MTHICSLGYHLAFGIWPFFLLQPRVVMTAASASACWKHGQQSSLSCVCPLMSTWGLLGRVSSRRAWCKIPRGLPFPTCPLLLRMDVLNSNSSSYYLSLLWQSFILGLRSGWAGGESEWQALCCPQTHPSPLTPLHCPSAEWCPSSLGKGSFSGRALIPHANCVWQGQPASQSSRQDYMEGFHWCLKKLSGAIWKGDNPGEKEGGEENLTE